MRTNRKKVTTKKRGFGLLDREKARKDAASAMKVLRRIAKDAGSDLSVPECYCNCLDYCLQGVEEALNDMLPPPGSMLEPQITGLFEDDDQPEDGATPAVPDGGSVI